jgi:hypothetical protein
MTIFVSEFTSKNAPICPVTASICAYHFAAILSRVIVAHRGGNELGRVRALTAAVRKG